MNHQPAVSMSEAIRRLTAPGAPFETMPCEIDGVSVRTYARAPATLRDILSDASQWGDRPYLHFEGELLGYDRVVRDARSLSSALHARFRVCKGDRVAICMRNYPEWVIAYWAVIRAGGIVVPVNAWGSGAEMAYVVAHSGASVLVLDPERRARLAPHLGELSLKGIIVARGEETDGDEDFDRIVAAYANTPEPPDPGLTPDDAVTIFYTSGTTGRPKGAVGTHRNAISCVISGGFNVALSHMRRTGQILERAPGAQPPPYLYGGPLFHVGGCNSGLAATMAAGACMVLMYRWDAGKALALIEELRVGGIGAVPTMVWQLIEHRDFEQYDLSSLAAAAIGGAAAGPELFARLKQRLPAVVAATGYGATETSGGCTFNGGLDYAMHPDGVGVAAPIVDVKVVDETGRELPRGIPGELCLRGACVLGSYWRDPDATSAAFKDGWFHSGDIARIDDEGRITILDRAKDMVIRGGENVYSIEVENALLAHENVVAAAVFGLPDLVLGETVAAVVQVIEGSTVTAAELRSFVGARLAHFKVPSTIRISSDELPKNETGKILKRVLRDELARSAAG